MKKADESSISMYCQKKCVLCARAEFLNQTTTQVYVYFYSFIYFNDFSDIENIQLSKIPKI